MMIQPEHVSLCEMADAATWAGWQRLSERMDLTGVKRVTVGSDLCEHQFLALGEQQAALMEALGRQGIAVSLAVPSPRQSLLDPVQEKIRTVLRRVPAVDELVFNDRYLLESWTETSHRLVAGRQLARYEHDFRLRNEREQLTALKRCAEDVFSGRASLLEADVIDPSCPDLGSIAPGRIRFHAPWTLISSMRYCQYAPDGVGLPSAESRCIRACEHLETVYRGRVRKLGRGIYRLIPQSCEIPSGVQIVYWPYAEYRGSLL